MQKVPSKDKRKLLPRWRPLTRVPRVELASTRKIEERRPAFHPEFQAAEQNWEGEPSHEAGVELVESAVTFGEAGLGSDAAKKLLADGDLRPLGRQLAQGLLGEAGALEETADEQIRQARQLLNAYPRNGILRTQMALAYVSTGQRNAALKQIELALASAPKNRFVLRSAARFFVHDGDPERALHAIERGGRSDDPWVLATQTSLADMVRRPKSIKGRDIRQLLNSGLHPSQLVELAVSFATLEISYGAVKPARKLINQFREHLNENAAAQIKWIEEDGRFGFNIDVSNVENSFEASALQFHSAGRWRDAVVMTEKWFSDEPFSTRAAILGSYISSAYIDENDVSIRLIDRALVANPNDISLINNRAFALSQAGRVEEAWAWLEKAKMGSIDEDSKVVVGATEANILVRSGRVFEGLEKYARSAIAAVDGNLLETRDRMIAHWLRELYLHDYILEPKLLRRFQDHYKDGGKSSPEARRLFGHIVVPLLEKSKQSEGDREVFVIHEGELFLDKSDPQAAVQEL